MKLAFLLLGLANLVFFAWQQGVFGGLPESGREPERVNRQVEPERIRVLTQGEVQALRAKAKEVPARDAAPAAPSSSNPAQPAVIAAADLAGMACVEVGDFTIENAGRVRQRLEAAQLGDRLTSTCPRSRHAPRSIGAPRNCAAPA
jgi:hypothetical protein